MFTMNWSVKCLSACHTSYDFRRLGI